MQPTGPEWTSRLGRDIAINVVANLIAAAVIYTAGTAAGLLTYSPLLIFASGVILLLAAYATLFQAFRSRTQNSGLLWRIATNYLFAVTMLTYIFYEMVNFPPSILSISLIVLCISLFAYSVYLIGLR